MLFGKSMFGSSRFYSEVIQARYFKCFAILRDLSCSNQVPIDKIIYDTENTSLFEFLRRKWRVTNQKLWEVVQAVPGRTSIQISSKEMSNPSMKMTWIGRPVKVRGRKHTITVSTDSMNRKFQQKLQIWIWTAWWYVHQIYHSAIWRIWQCPVKPSEMQHTPTLCGRFSAGWYTWTRLQSISYITVSVSNGYCI